MGSRKTHDGAENIYKAANLWVERALKSDDSLFTPALQSGQLRILKNSASAS